MTTSTDERVIPDDPSDVKVWCAAGKDGECNWADCPQLRDGEPEKSGRFCPLPGWGDYEE